MSETNKLVINVLREAAEEISRLRRVNEILEAKVSVIAVFEAALHKQDPQTMQVVGMRRDVWESIQNVLVRLEKAEQVVERLQGGSLYPEEGNTEAAIGTVQQDQLQDQLVRESYKAWQEQRIRQAMENNEELRATLGGPHE